MTPFPPKCRLLGSLAVLALAFVLTVPAQADDAVRVTVMAILATDRNKEVDEDLTDIADRVQKAEPKLTGFRKGRTTALPVGVGGKGTFSLVEEESATVMVDAILKEKAKMTVKPPTLGAVTYTTAYDKFFPIVTRYETKNKDRLIVAIMVEGKGK